MGLGLMLACATPNADAANALAPLFNVSMMLLSGFYINVNSLPDGEHASPTPPTASQPGPSLTTMTLCLLPYLLVIM